MQKLRGAIFGCGMISEFHLRGWQRLPVVEIVALGDQVVEHAEMRREQFVPLARLYDDLPTLLNAEKLDFIDILTPPSYHREHCLLAREAGIHVICQKPLCDNLTDAGDLVAAFAHYPKIFTVHENHRYRPWFQTILKLHDEGFFGTVRYVRLEHLNPTVPNEAYKLASEAGVLLEYGTHLVDMMRALLGDPTRVYARLHKLNPQVNGESLSLVPASDSDD